MVVTRKMAYAGPGAAQRLSAGEILDELLTDEAMCEACGNQDVDQYRQVVYKGPLTLSCSCWRGYQEASSFARDTSLRCARDGDRDDSWYVYGTFEAPGEDGFFTVQTFIETLDEFDHSTRDREEDICLNFSRPNDRKHLLIDALTGEEVVAFQISHDT